MEEWKNYKLGETQRLVNLRDTLLPRLMSGEISVDQIEKNDL